MVRKSVKKRSQVWLDLKKMVMARTPFSKDSIAVLDQKTRCKVVYDNGYLASIASIEDPEEKIVVASFRLSAAKEN